MGTRGGGGKSHDIVELVEAIGRHGVFVFRGTRLQLLESMSMSGAKPGDLTFIMQNTVFISPKFRAYEARVIQLNNIK